MQNRLKLNDPRKIVTLANFISLIRAALAIPIVYTLRDPSLGSITLFLILVAIMSDALDGWVARKADEVTYFGQWVDPIADFICILSVVSYLVLSGLVPAWFFLFYIIIKSDIINIKQPKSFILENVKNIMSIEDGDTWKFIIKELYQITNAFLMSHLVNLLEKNLTYGQEEEEHQYCFLFMVGIGKHLTKICSDLSQSVLLKLVHV